jgi:hypothetical protein
VLYIHLNIEATPKTFFMLRLKNDFNKMSDPLLSTRTSQILTAMNGNASFPTPTPSVEVMGGIYENFTDALGECDGSSEQSAIKNQIREELVAALLQ